ncbi:flagellar basal body P-ring formation chaperone FlgA [Niveispirillum irakense]|uniref:flagellar basal body P-ring formation chaperone FlgA n=1 Tax=Niveispirillum irakense TaxID=34011 RepID=UPI00041027E0|nr:flagellar basal body P-ring formation chaperone FlgA [Niveispirillum irakense]
MRVLPCLLTAVSLALAAALPVTAQPAAPVTTPGMEAQGGAEAALVAAFRERYGAALGQGTLRLRITPLLTGAVEAVETLQFDPSSRRFAAILVQDGARKRVDGELWSEVEVPVPNRRLSPGEVITKDDLAMMPMRSDQIGGRALTDPASLIGMEARRVLSPGRPIPSNSVINAPLVRRNGAVTVEYRQDGLVLTAKGRALGDGAQGDVIRVQNMDSNRTLTATVTAPGVVSAAN